jgi:hypothetical protein
VRKNKVSPSRIPNSQASPSLSIDGGPQGMWRGFEQINVIRKDERDSGELMEKE